MELIAKTNEAGPLAPMTVLTDDEVNIVAGGNAILVFLAGGAAVFAALNAAEGFGEKCGHALYYATH